MMSKSRKSNLWFYGFFTVFFAVFAIFGYTHNNVFLGVFDTMVGVIDLLVFISYLKVKKTNDSVKESV
jgi:hypothetical protein